MNKLEQVSSNSHQMSLTEGQIRDQCPMSGGGVPTPDTWDTPLLPPLTPSGGHHTCGRYTCYWNAIFSFHNSYGKHDQSKDMRNYRKASLFDDETKSWAMCARQIKIWLKGEHGVIGGKLRGRINGRSDLQKKFVYYLI